MAFTEKQLIDIVKQVEDDMIAPGGIFELHTETVFGIPMKVFKHRQQNLREILLSSANHGNNTYIVCDGRRFSYAEHLQLVATVAQNLQTKYKIQKGDRVAILADNHPEWIITFWATISLGAIAVGLNGWWTRREILYGLELSEPKILIADQKRYARIADDDIGIPIVIIENNYAAELLEKTTDVLPTDDTLPTTDIQEDDPALILFTSGTTGHPKGAVITHRSLVNFVTSAFFNGYRTMMVKEARKTQGEALTEEAFTLPTGLYTAPLFHLSGLFAGALASLAAGLKTVWCTGRFEPENILSLIQNEKISIWAALGSMAQRLMDHPRFADYDVSSITILGSGGAPTSRNLQDKMQEKFPGAKNSMAVGYGLTESTGAGTTNWNEFLTMYPDSCGRPFPGLEMAIHDVQGNSLPPNTQGEICIRGACVMQEYWRNSQATAAAISQDRWLKTGDIGRINDDGFLFINTRARELILRNAENIYPVEIEHCLERHPAVKEAAVVGVDHPVVGQEVKAIIVPKAGIQPPIENMQAFCQEFLAPFKVPTLWEIRAAPLPRNAAGKILKNVLTGMAEHSLIEE